MNSLLSFLLSSQLDSVLSWRFQLNSRSTSCSQVSIEYRNIFPNYMCTKLRPICTALKPRPSGFLLLYSCKIVWRHNKIHCSNHNKLVQQSGWLTLVKNCQVRISWYDRTMIPWRKSNGFSLRFREAHAFRGEKTPFKRR